MLGDNGSGTSGWRHYAPVIISGGYLVAASLYIFTSDELLAQLTNDSIELTRLQMLKGIAFVAVTALLLFWLLHRIRQRFRRVEARSALSQERFRQMIETTNEGVWIVDDNARTIFVNETMAEMLGYSVDELIGRPLVDLIDPTSRDIASEQFERRKNGSRDVYECQLHDREGRARWVLIASSPLNDLDGQFLGSLKMVTDITERKQAEDALAEACRAQQKLLNELNHRVRNNLSALLGLIELGRTRASDVGEFASSIGGRVGAMNRAYTLLAESHWDPPPLRHLIEIMVDDDVRHAIRTDGPEVRVPPQQVGALALVVQELLNDSLTRCGDPPEPGCITITWNTSVGDDQGVIVDLDWEDRPGAAMKREPSSHFPSIDLIKGLVRSDLRGEVELNQPGNGVRHHIRMWFTPLARATPAPIRQAVLQSLTVRA